MTIDVYEIEEFELPDGNIVEIIPIRTEDMDLLLKFMDLAKKVDKLKLVETKSRKKAGELNDKQVTKSMEMAFNDLSPIADKLIDKATRLKGKWDEVKVTKIEPEYEVEGTIYHDVEIPVMEFKEGKIQQKVKKVPIPLPEEYRTLSNRIELTQKIIKVSTGDVDSVADSPLLPNQLTKSQE
jgi:hypothetical protein